MSGTSATRPDLAIRRATKRLQEANEAIVNEARRFTATLNEHGAWCLEANREEGTPANEIWEAARQTLMTTPMSLLGAASVLATHALGGEGRNRLETILRQAGRNTLEGSIALAEFTVEQLRQVRDRRNTRIGRNNAVH